MKSLTREILDKEAEKYFPEIKAKLNIGVFDEFFIMEDYIHKALELAKHLIDNKYPQEDILNMLPKDFSLKVAERLR
jgi:hypothetical protein